MSDKYKLFSTVEMDKRIAIATEFYESIFNKDEIPYFVTDEATLYDIFAGDDDELIEAVRKHYGVSLNIEHFKIKFWILLEFLEKNRT